MSGLDFHAALLRPAVIQILRAAGFNYTKNSVIDTVTDLASRYMHLLGSTTAQHAFNNHNDYVPTVQDVRLALLDVGALRPQLSVLEEEAKRHLCGSDPSFEDMRGVDGFVTWARGPVNKEIRRIAGYSSGSGDLEDNLAVLDENEDYVTALKKKHSKTGEESRYQGSTLGKDVDSHQVTVVGGPVSSVSQWAAQLRSHTLSPAQATPASSGISSAPPTPMDSTDAVDDTMVTA